VGDGTIWAALGWRFWLFWETGILMKMENTAKMFDVRLIGLHRASRIRQSGLDNDFEQR